MDECILSRQAGLNIADISISCFVSMSWYHGCLFGPYWCCRFNNLFQLSFDGEIFSCFVSSLIIILFLTYEIPSHVKSLQDALLPNRPRARIPGRSTFRRTRFEASRQKHQAMATETVHCSPRRWRRCCLSYFWACGIPLASRYGWTLHPAYQ